VLALWRERPAATPVRASVLERSDYRRGGESRQLWTGVWSSRVANGSKTMAYTSNGGSREAANQGSESMAYLQGSRNLSKKKSLWIK